jgi:hypothetical protein
MNVNWIEDGGTIPPPIVREHNDFECLGCPPRLVNGPSHFLEKWLLPGGPAQAMKGLNGELRQDPRFLFANLLQLEQWTQYEREQLLARADVKNEFLKATVSINSDRTCAQYITEADVRAIARGAFAEQIRLHNRLVMFADDESPEHKTAAPESRLEDIGACRTKWQRIRSLLGECVDLVNSWNNAIKSTPIYHLLPHAEEDIFTYDFGMLEDYQAAVNCCEGPREMAGQLAGELAMMEFDALGAFRAGWGRDHHELRGVFCKAVSETWVGVPGVMYPALIEAYHNRRAM